MNDKLPRVAALGGTRGISVAGNYQRNGFARMTAVCDINRRTAEERLANLKLPSEDKPRVFEDPGEMLNWGEFDAVIVATPDDTHYALASEVLLKGFHCFVEKPMATTIADAVDLVRIWRASGKLGVVGHEFRHASMVTEAKQKIDSGVIGTPRMAVTMDACGRMGSYWRRREWRSDARPQDNSLTLQKAIHQLDIQSYLMNSRPHRVFASAGSDHYGGDKPGDLHCVDCRESKTCPYHADRMKINYVREKEPAKDGLCVYARNLDIHDNQTVVIEYESGSRGSYVECFFTPDYKTEHTVIGDLGRLSMRYFYRNPFQEIEVSWIGRRKSERWVCPAIGGHGGGDHILGQSFTSALTEGRQIQPDLIEGCWAVALAKCIDNSAASGSPVEIPDEVRQTCC